jgi:outer membrane protein
VLAACALAPARAQSLHELYLRALASDPAVAAAQAQVRAADERVFQSRASYGPTAAVTATTNETRYREGPDFELREFRGKQGVLQVTQPLIRPALLFGLEAAQALAAQAQALLDQAHAETAQRLVEAAFEVLKARDTLALAGAQRVAVAEQLAQAQRAFRVGTVPVTDVREAEAKADAVAAQVLAAEVDLELRQQMLAELAGPAPGLITRGLTGEHLPPLAGASLPEWLVAAVAGSAQLRQAQHALLAVEAEVRKAWQGHMPTLDLTYSHTTNSDTGTITSPFPRRGDAMAVGLSLNIPLFASGATQSKVRETLALRDKAQGEVDAARRSVTLALRQAFAAAMSAIGQARALEAAVRSQELAVQANRRAYEVGMKVNTDVLEAQSKLFEARRDLSRARYDAWTSYVKLKALAARLNDVDIAQLAGLLVEQPAASLHMPRPRGTSQ